ncbi:hypothetical protein [Streptomyces apocyni]|uniref:hypothetical protein n=1 Tax=Streptomyces apocyni TaxID=2654677 RepID=UPI0012E997AF|nr:hypothetical protein [Streptomyces apocyni]
MRRARKRNKGIKAHRPPSPTQQPSTLHHATSPPAHPSHHPQHHLRTRLKRHLWGPAEYTGSPPRWLSREGVVVSALSTAAIITAGAAGALTGTPVLFSGMIGVLLTLSLAIYLITTRAGHLLVAAVTILGVTLALQSPEVAAEAVLANRGEPQTATVTSIAFGTAAHCSVAAQDGRIVRTTITRGCSQTTRPGDAIGIISDPKGHLRPRGAGFSESLNRSLAKTTGLALALASLCYLTVIRSYRLPRPRPPR